MNDTEIVDWIQDHLYELTIDLDGVYEMDYYDDGGTVQVIRGKDLRECVINANVSD